MRPVSVVGLGGSAGALEPLQQLLGQVPVNSGRAYVVVQHLDPTRETVLVQLLQRATSLPVHEALEAQPVQPNTVYVIPPGMELTLVAGALHLAAPVQPRGQRLPVDALFGSLARELGERAVGVVLSGMGQDGTLGLQAIKLQGGLTLAQQPESASFDAMPRSAIASGHVDIVALPADMPSRIEHIAPGAEPPAAWAQADTEADTQATLAKVLALLHKRTGHDLGMYKATTLLRRIGRRMAVHGLPSMVAYVRLLRSNPQELDLLFKEALIGVTAFFRDPEVWRDLKDQVLPVLVQRHAPGAGPLRAWVAACSTGEEAYSLAMAFTEVLDALPVQQRPRLQIFATDLNADAIASARTGRYAAASVDAMEPERRARFFAPCPGGYQIDKRIRDSVLFAKHDLITDPPFTRLDLVLCRNLFIYLEGNLQKRLVPLFHYSLRRGGALVLGSSETVGRAQALFKPLGSKSRLYWRSENGVAAGALVFPTQGRPQDPSSLKETPLSHDPSLASNLQTLADQVLLQAHAPPAVLVNADGDVVYISGRTGRYLEPAAGKANWNIHVMARPAIRAQVAVALRTALHDQTTVELHGLRLGDDSTATVDISVQAVVQPRALTGMAMIVFRDQPQKKQRNRKRAPEAGGAGPAVSEELLRTREELHALRQEMRASHEELQAANEELQSTNEELQSANEELTTSKEEAQSMNEELQTINGELQTKLDDLALAQSDMQNLLNSTDIATLFLDDRLNVRRFTKQIERVIHLRESDIGRPLSELASTLLYPEMHDDVKETLRSLVVSQKDIATSDGHWFNVRVMPYRTLSNVIQGVVVTFVDITVAKELEARLRRA